MDSAMVIKVKYGDTLRRFNANVDENGQLNLDMEMLSSKILGLFNFPGEADLTLTYIDEDGDVVTLADDDDLHDAMRQNLKFLRIDVQLSNDRFGKSYAGSSGSSTPMRSSRVQNQLPCLNNSVTEVLKSVPEPLREVLSKLSFELASKAVASSAVLTELVDCFSKMGLSHLNPNPPSHDGSGSSNQPGASEIPAMPSLPIVPNASKEGEAQKGLPKSNSPFKTSPKRGFENVINPTVASSTATPALVDLNLNPQDLNPFVDCAPPAPFVPAGGGAKEDKKQNTGHSTGRSIHIAPPTIPTNHAFPLHTGCPFSGMPMANDSAVHPIRGRVSKSNFLNNPMVGMFHRGVQCDGCGIHPITGPRYKSKVKEDYDLCSFCFIEMGNEADYIKMDRPMPYHRNPWSFKGFNDPRSRAHPQSLCKGYGVKGAQPKLDSRFVLDVNVSDGTVMAPSTPFTKIWRMRNSGCVAWPQGVRLVWIGGDRFFNADSVEIEIPVNGVPVDGELDIAADFVSPALPGRYISYWRMAYPSGGKFGQRVWVLIEIDASLKDPLFKDLNLNESPNCMGSTCPDVLDINAQPGVDACFVEDQNPTSVSEPLVPTVDEQPKNQELNFPIDDALLVGQGVSAPAHPQFIPASVSISYPIIDTSETVPVAQSLPCVDVPTSSGGINVDNAVEKSLLKELEEMGFKQVDLNKEILRRNEYDLEQSVDDLCGVVEWDPILEELQEMGFCDKEMNKKLLKKNNGSIKGVVMDILTGGRP